MPRTDRNEVFDETGKLLSVEIVQAPDPAPSPAERIAQLETQVAQLAGTMDAVAKAPSFEQAKAEIATRIENGAIELPMFPPGEPEEPVKEVKRV